MRGSTPMRKARSLKTTIVPSSALHAETDTVWLSGRLVSGRNSCWRRFTSRIVAGLLVGTLLLSSPRLPTLSTSAGPIRLTSSGPEAAVIEFTLPHYTLREASAQGRTFIKVEADGLTLSTEPGTPQLPQIGVLLGLPPDGVPTLRVLEAQHIRVPVAYPVYPAPAPKPVRPANGELPASPAHEFALKAEI